jgi:hypothetical protein
MDKENNSEAQMTINSFTELLTGPISVELLQKIYFKPLWFGTSLKDLEENSVMLLLSFKSTL